MACIRKRRGKWVVDYRDGAGIRRWTTCQTRRDAEQVLAERVRATGQHSRPAVDPNISVAQYAERWLSIASSGLKRGTVHSYDGALKRHILPILGHTKLRKLHRMQIKDLLVLKLGSGLARGTVAFVHATLRAMLSAAVDDCIIVANPANKLGRKLRLGVSRGTLQEQTKAFTREQLNLFLETAKRSRPNVAPVCLLLSRTGMRLGEAVALQWNDVDFEHHEIRVARSLWRTCIQTPKSGHGRTVDMSAQLAARLKVLRAERAAETLKRGWREVPIWIFCTSEGKPLHPSWVQEAFKRVLKDAKLPLHFSPHCLRHTFASLLLQQGESPVYVQRQLGHATIQLTVDTYGRWLPLGNKAAVNRLDDPSWRRSGSKTVATDPGMAPAATEILDGSTTYEATAAAAGQTSTTRARSSSAWRSRSPTRASWPPIRSRTSSP
jgi:integrase